MAPEKKPKKPPAKSTSAPSGRGTRAKRQKPGIEGSTEAPKEATPSKKRKLSTEESPIADQEEETNEELDGPTTAPTTPTDIARLADEQSAEPTTSIEHALVAEDENTSDNGLAVTAEGSPTKKHKSGSNGTLPYNGMPPPPIPRKKSNTPTSDGPLSENTTSRKRPSSSAEDSSVLDENEPSAKKQKLEAESRDASKRHIMLYQRCLAAKPIGESFTVAELAAFGIAENEVELMELAQILVDSHMFVPMSLNRGFVYKARSRGTALKLFRLNVEEHMIYQHVEGTGSTGSWKRSLVTKTNLHEHIVGRILKELCEKKLLKEIKSAKFPTRRVYLLEYLEPSKENLGGTFFESGALDEGLLVALGMICRDFIDKESWIRRRNPNASVSSRDRKSSSKISKRKQDQEASKLDAQNRDGEKHNTNEDTVLEEEPRSASLRPTKPKDILIPYPPNYAHYPKAADVLQAVNETGIIKNLKLGEADIQQILTTLEYDGSIERTRNLDGMVELGYRSVKRGWTGRWGPPTWFGPLEPPYVDLLDEGELGVGLGNALTQTPCGRCPVFRDCRPGGVVSPEGCVYLDKWLEF